ncbi:hypothetical protein BTVI_72080 [Pitangus sulphuratus]|nr:hypothetical protein BTVI_72080 [Pitangus sulphuratus]
MRTLPGPLPKGEELTDKETGMFLAGRGGEGDAEVGNTKLSGELVARNNVQDPETLPTCGSQPKEQMTHEDKIQPQKIQKWKS